jgi:hypothetical protein
MRNLLAFLGALIVTFAAVGWYLGWYKVHTEPGPDGHKTVKVDVDTKKAEDDIEKGTVKLEDIINHHNQTANATDNKQVSKPKIEPPPGWEIPKFPENKSISGPEIPGGL